MPCWRNCLRTSTLATPSLMPTSSPPSSAESGRSYIAPLKPTTGEAWCRMLARVASFVPWSIRASLGKWDKPTCWWKSTGGLALRRAMRLGGGCAARGQSVRPDRAANLESWQCRPTGG